jgi:oxygen-independent coproporphyrinogen-3 oxidase
MIDYIRWVDEQVIAPRPAFLPNDDEVECSIDLDSLTDIIMTRLRTSDGLDLDWIRDNVPGGQDVVEMIMKGAGMALDLGLAEHVRSERDGGILGSLRLVDPSGFLFSNSIISSIFVELGSEG